MSFIIIRSILFFLQKGLNDGIQRRLDPGMLFFFLHIYILNVFLKTSYVCTERQQEKLRTRTAKRARTMRQTHRSGPR